MGDVALDSAEVAVAVPAILVEPVSLAVLVACCVIGLLLEAQFFVDAIALNVVFSESGVVGVVNVFVLGGTVAVGSVFDAVFPAIELCIVMLCCADNFTVLCLLMGAPSCVPFALGELLTES